MLEPQQRLQQRDQAPLFGGTQGALLGLVDQLLDLGLINLSRLWSFHWRSCLRKSFLSGYTHTILTGNCPRR